jgi:hypothetical protein
MAKSTGLGDNFYIAGYNISGDTNSLSKISGAVAPIDVTDITQSAYGRLGGLRTGEIDFTVYMDPAAGASHVALSSLPTADALATYFRGTAIGNPAASMTAKQIDYNPTRSPAGDLTFAVACQSNAFGLEWGAQLTAGLRTDTSATNGTSNNDGAATAFGAQAYLQVTAFAGTDCTVTIQDSADNVSFAAVSGLAFTAVTSAPTTQRIFISNVSTLRQYVRAITTTSAGFTSITFAVQYTRNLTAGIVF